MGAISVDGGKAAKWFGNGVSCERAREIRGRPSGRPLKFTDPLFH